MAHQLSFLNQYLKSISSFLTITTKRESLWCSETSIRCMIITQITWQNLGKICHRSGKSVKNRSSIKMLSFVTSLSLIMWHCQIRLSETSSSFGPSKYKKCKQDLIHSMKRHFSSLIRLLTNYHSMHIQAFWRKHGKLWSKIRIWTCQINLLWQQRFDAKRSRRKL